MQVCLPVFSSHVSLRVQATNFAGTGVRGRAIRTVANKFFGLMAAKTNEEVPASDKAGRTALEESSKEGAFVRKESTFRNWISEDSEKFKPEGGLFQFSTRLRMVPKCKMFGIFRY
jgi:hypothetical protein